MAWEDVARLDEIEVGETLRVEPAGPVCLVRVDDDEVRAIGDTCPHQGQSLSEGLLQPGGTLVCAFHAAEFDLTTGASVGLRATDAVPVHPCRVRDGVVQVDLAG